MNYKVIKNFLPIKEFKILQDYLFNGEIGWFFRNTQTSDSKNKDYYFTHSFYNNFRINSEVFIPLIVPILNRLNAVMIDEIRANLFVNRFKQIKSDAHIDKSYIHTNGNLIANLGFFSFKNAELEQLHEILINTKLDLNMFYDRYSHVWSLGKLGDLLLENKFSKAEIEKMFEKLY